MGLSPSPRRFSDRHLIRTSRLRAGRPGGRFMRPMVRGTLNVFLDALLIACVSRPVAAETPAGEVRVARLVRQLGAAEAQTRESAQDALLGLGAGSRAPLEQALAHDDPEVRLRARVLLDECLTEELWSASQVAFPPDERLATSVLNSIVAQTGNRLLVGDQYGAFNEVRFDGAGERMPFWQAVDRLCHATGNHLRPHYDLRAGGLVVCGGAPGQFPCAYSGPLRAQITGARRVFVQELDYAETNSEVTHTFQLSLQMTWEERFRLLGYTTQPELVEARTDTGELLSAVQPSSGSWNTVTPKSRHVTTTLRLSPPPSGSKRLDLLKLRWPLLAVGDRQTLIVTNLTAGSAAQQEDLALCIESIEKQPSGRYELVLIVSRDRATPEPAEMLFQENEIELFDAAGRPLRLQNHTHQLVDRGVQIRLQFVSETAGGEPALMRVAYPRLRARRAMELVFRDVPLPTAEPK